MTMSKEAEEQECNLRKQFQHLEDDWDSYKQSVPRRRRSCSSMTLMADAAAALELLRNSPKKLMRSLQQYHTPAADFSRPKPHDQADKDITNDRTRESTGRRLLEALDCAKVEVCGHGREETRSPSSSALIQGPEATSPGSCSSCGCALVIDKHVKVAYVSSSVSDSSSSSTPKNVDQVEMDAQRINIDDCAVGTKGMTSLTLVLLSIIFIIITLAFVFMLVKRSAVEAYECCIVPT